MSNIWTARSNTTLALLQEGVEKTINLPVQSDAEIRLIAGTIPPGMELIGTTITGTPQEVAKNTKFRFVLRAIVNNSKYDRTFSISIQGADDPVWQTPEDLLAVGNNETYFILDSYPVDFQLEALDPDLEAGQTLRYFIASGDGILPPGITLTEDGRLIGVVDPILALEKESEQGFYDQGRFDRTPYDFAIKSSIGYSSFFYDLEVYDYAVNERVPRKLNRYYQFTVSVSDGYTVAKRTFRIFVVGDDFLRSDNTVMNVGTGIFTADNTFVRNPIWLTPKDLGVRRANNFITLFLDTLDPNQVPGIIVYKLELTNPGKYRLKSTGEIIENGKYELTGDLPTFLQSNFSASSPDQWEVIEAETFSELPPGTDLDEQSGEVFGRIPYQPAVTKTYKFTVNARRVAARNDLIDLNVFTEEEALVGSTSIRINKLRENTNRVKNKKFEIQKIFYTVIGIDTSSTDYDVLFLDKPLETYVKPRTGIDLGVISVSAQEVAETLKTFNVQLIGEIDSTIQWITPSDLGSIPSNYISILKIQAETTVPDSFLFYTLESGTLPPGLELSFSGEIFGKVRNQQIPTDTNYSFTVKARDQFGLSAITQTFNLLVKNKDDTLYSNIYYKPLLPRQNRNQLTNFLTDNSIVSPEDIYRINDPNFGIQKETKILLYAGIETVEAKFYVSAAAKYAKRKTLKVRDVKSAVAKEPGTNNEIYEVVYLDVFDPAESNDNKKKIKISTNQLITVDSIKTTPDNPLYDTTTLSYLNIGQRGNNDNKIYFNTNLQVETRNDIELISFENFRFFPTREFGKVEILFNQGSETNIFYRANLENLIGADSDAVRVSDSKSQTRYLSNTSNLRENLRDVGKNERDFLPLWMRTPQEGSLQELGFTLAVPLIYCKPGNSELILAAIRNSNFDLKQLHLEIDRFIIDATQGRSQEQYILFANYEFNL
jgi:hypothetical protein